MCELPFTVERDNMRRGSMEHVKGRVGSFWGTSAASNKSRVFSIYSKGSEQSKDKQTPRDEDDSFNDF